MYVVALVVMALVGGTLKWCQVLGRQLTCQVEEEAHDVHVLYMCTCMYVCAVDLPDLHSAKCFKVI